MRLLCSRHQHSNKPDPENAKASKIHDDSKIARQIIYRYLRVPKEERYKKALNLYDMIDEGKRRADKELCKLRHKIAQAKYHLGILSLIGSTLNN